MPPGHKALNSLHMVMGLDVHKHIPPPPPAGPILIPHVVVRCIGEAMPATSRASTTVKMGGGFALGRQHDIGIAFLFPSVLTSPYHPFAGLAMTASAPDASAPPRLSALNVVDHPDKGSQVGVVAKRTYRVRGGRCIVDDEQVAMVEAPDFGEDGAVLLHDMDQVLNRRQTDIVVIGKAHVPRKTGSFDIRVRVGALDRVIRAFGDRRCARDAAGRLHFSDPQPVEEVDLGWRSAYGGVDRIALGKNGDPIEAICERAGQPYDPRFGLFAYPRNRVGKGYLIEASDEALEACALPNIEDPAQLLSPERLAVGRPERWPLANLVAGMGWLSYSYFPRSAMVGLPPVYDPVTCPPASFPEVRMGILKPRSIVPETPLQERFDLAAAQQSAIGMRVAEVTPGAPADLVNCHPQLHAWTFALPREVPTLMVQMPGESAIALDPKIRTVLLEPNLDRVCIVWVGEYHVPTPVGPGKLGHVRHGVRWGA